ncbi:MAG: 50S ribosomal protein L23 [Patescibacteria group bacterium]|nr:50S ribosomal protein L23 [Patescibacteria group bacterium]
MGIFKKSTTKKVEEAKTKIEESALQDIPEKNVSTAAGKGLSMKLVKHPHLSEKAHDFMENNKYVFIVDKSANKLIIKREIENKYHVSVISVNIILNKGKLKKWRNKVSRREGLKKAIVTVKPGQKIEIT